MSDSLFATAHQMGYSEPWLYFYWGEVKLKRKQYRSAEEYLKTAIDAGIQEEALFDAYQQALAALQERN